MSETVKRYLISVAIVGSLVLGYKAYDSYRHFEWQNAQMKQGGPVVAIPSWRKD